MGMEESLVDRCLKRARDYSGTPYTQHRLVEQCSRDISLYGPDAHTSVHMKGAQGYGIKQHRRLIPSGPLGKVCHTYSGQLHVEFPSVQLLIALRNPSTAFHELAGYYTASYKAPYPQQMPIEMAVQFAHEHIGIEIEPDAVDAIFQNNPPGPFGNGRMVIFYLLEVEHIAKKRRWKRVDLAKWQTAGLTWPLVKIQRTRSAPPKPASNIYRVTDRHAKLLRLFNQADEAGKQRIEQSAAAIVVAAH